VKNNAVYDTLLIAPELDAIAVQLANPEDSAPIGDEMIGRLAGG
jgi:hypothetical protein